MEMGAEMPCLYTSEDFHRQQREKRKLIERKLIAKGINPRGLKFIGLVHRMMRNP